MSYMDALGQWDLLVADFHSEYTIDLQSVYRVKSWDWFITLVEGLFACDCRLSRHFRKDEVPDERGTNYGGVDYREAANGFDPMAGR